ncbi:MAG: hypothetical protein ACK55Z_09665, partial [bacterium]
MRGLAGTGRAGSGAEAAGTAAPADHVPGLGAVGRSSHRVDDSRTCSSSSARAATSSAAPGSHRRPCHTHLTASLRRQHLQAHASGNSDQGDGPVSLGCLGVQQILLDHSEKVRALFVERVRPGSPHFNRAVEAVD